MHDSPFEYEFTFPSMPVGKRETPHNLKRLLYKGGASCRIDRLAQAIEDGLLGHVLQDRVELVRLIHDFIDGQLVAGGSAKTARDLISCMLYFFGWADSCDQSMNLSVVEVRYFEWIEHLFQRTRTDKDLAQVSAYNQGRLVGQVLDSVLNRGSPIVRSTRLKRPSTGKPARGIEAEKQLLSTTFAFGRVLQDVCDGLPLKAIFGLERVLIPLRQGGEVELPTILPEDPNENQKISADPSSSALTIAYDASGIFNHRRRVDRINLRLQAELLMFIGQTGINFAQAQNIPLRRFSYSSHNDGYQIREYKRRRGGEVLFEIFSEYRSHFERFLTWRREIFPKEETRLFPFFRRLGTLQDRSVKFGSMKSICKKVTVSWTPPSVLRGTRVNWILRRSGDPDLTAEIAQHHKQTLLNVYEVPSLQRAISEITRFHLRNDPSVIGKAIVLAVAPGACSGTPEASPTKPESVPSPDCKRPSGCLWCEHHRDIDTFDYVWSLACFRHLKSLELSKLPPQETGHMLTHPAEHAMQRAGEKLSWFRASSTVRSEWVVEALARVEESYYHDQWSYLIESVEMPLR